MAPQTDLILFKERGAAVQVVVSEIMNQPAAFAYAVELTKKQGRRVLSAIHLSRQEVSELFTQFTGETQAPDIGNLVKVARKKLRKAFLTADMGISGANFAIAATGTLPRVHVALVGEEGAIFRWTFLHSVGMCAIIAVLTLLQAYWLKFMLP
jgi:hypothetical protein